MHPSNIYATKEALKEWAAQSFSSDDTGGISLIPHIESFSANTRLAITVVRFGRVLTTLYAYAAIAARNADTGREVNVGSVVYGETNGPLAFWSGSAWTVDAFVVSPALRGALSSIASSLVILDGVPIPGPQGTTEFSDLEGLPSTLEGYGITDGATSAQIDAIAKRAVFVTDHGAVPDCTGQGVGTDVGPALKAAWDHAISTIGDGACIVLPQGRYRQSTPVVLDGQGRHNVSLVCEGTITPDNVAMTVIAVRNMIGFRMKASFLKGGRWNSGASSYGYYVDYSTTADVVSGGGQEAVLVQGVFDCTVDLSAFGYAGRLINVGSRIDPSHPQTGAMKGCLTTNRDHDFSKPSVAQSLWSDTSVIGQGNWGHLDRLTCDFDVWGPVWRNWNDISVSEIDAGFHYTGPKFEGCEVCEFDNFYVGTISAPIAGAAHVSILPSTERNSSQFRSTKMRFLDHGDGLKIKNATSVKIGRLDGGGVGALTMIDIDNSQVVHIDSASLNAGERALRVTGGGSDQIYIGLNGRGTVTDNHVHVAANVGGLVVLNNLNLNQAAAGKSLVKVDGPALVFIEMPLLYSTDGNITDLAAGNKVHIRNGAVLGAAGLSKSAAPRTILGTVGNDGGYI
ncbi:hypothetical protein G8E10_17760 [Rhizobiaceae bacterium CRRU44]|uniref:Pectate lyase superfamily protein domain-containing protein n=1 Tax=Ferranicluibacter rubi TaxID=2715133 RepID=A0AA43ZGQ9_9HYPH|nr:hypothetical protein [Ferranicluibacter rubi]NHT77563.1 hypothetical protein [Ferranicluibacter rubi]